MSLISRHFCRRPLVIYMETTDGARSEMKATSHFAMAHLLHAAMQKRGIFLNRIAFVYGNIAPDYTPAMWVAPHFSKHCSKMEAALFNELSQLPLSSTGRIGAEYSKKLGFMCHFLCDYFCFAHNEDFSGGIKQHMSYEDELDTYIRKNCLSVLDLDEKAEVDSISSAQSLFNDMEKQKATYFAIGHSTRNDLTFAFDACMSSLVNITGISKRLPSAGINQAFDDHLSSRRFESGNNLIFKMFFFKYRNSNLFFLPDLMPPIGVY